MTHEDDGRDLSMPHLGTATCEVTELESVKDLEALMVGDVVRARVEHEGRIIEKGMAVIPQDTENGVPRKLKFVSRVSPHGIYYLSAPFNELTVSGGMVGFDYSQGEWVRRSEDLPRYGHLMDDLQRAGLE